jgi:mRNA-degrading endonuclease toxin of MazEF toxin-antitoxin module
VVVSPDSFNRAGADLVLAAITSQLREGSDVVELRDGDVEGVSLPKPSNVRPAKIFTLHSSLVLKRICRLTPGKTAELADWLAAFFSSVGSV